MIDTEQEFRNALQSLIERKLLPPGTIPQQIYFQLECGRTLSHAKTEPQEFNFRVAGM